jgi:hypothetical protein
MYGNCYLSLIKIDRGLYDVILIHYFLSLR